MEYYCTTVSLGHGFPIVTGMALSRKLQRRDVANFMYLISDGECAKRVQLGKVCYTMPLNTI